MVIISASLILIVVEIAWTIAIVWILHTKIGKYPEPLPESENPRREIGEAILFFGVAIVSVFILFFSVIYSSIDLTEQFSLPIKYLTILVFGVSMIILPIAYVRFVNKWNAEDLGVTTKVLQQKVWIYVIGIQFITAVLGVITDPRITPPVLFLLLGLIAPAITEEVIFRGVIQSKLERGLGQNKGWFYAGILFALVHVPQNFIFPILLGGAPNILVGVILLGTQSMAGWFFGITYTKTRSIVPCIIIHYMGDFCIAILSGLLS